MTKTAPYCAVLGIRDIWCGSGSGQKVHPTVQCWGSVTFGADSAPDKNRTLPCSVGDPYLWLMDPDPGGPKTCGSGSPTLLPCKNIPECALPAMTASCPVCLTYLSKAEVANTLARTQLKILVKGIEAWVFSYVILARQREHTCSLVPSSRSLLKE
jgi:hypothetical protein